MSVASGGRVWALPTQKVTMQSSSSSRKASSWVAWSACILAVAVLPVLALVFFGFPVWYDEPTGIKSVAGGYIDTSDSYMSGLNFFLWVCALIGGIVGIVFVNKKFRRRLNPLMIAAFVLLTFCTSLADNETKFDGGFDQWVKDTYGYTTNQGIAPSLDKMAIYAKDANGAKTTLNILRSDGNIYLYANVIEEEELRNKIKAAKANEK